MTVIAWDGKTLAADKQGTSCGLKITLTKIKKLENGAVVAWTGKNEHGIELSRWYLDGADPEKWPAYQGTEDWTRLIVADKGKVFSFEQRPVPQPVEDPIQAWGCGRDFALGAMALGANAVGAVEIASRFADGCGMGVDAFDVSQ